MIVLKKETARDRVNAVKGTTHCHEKDSFAIHTPRYSRNRSLTFLPACLARAGVTCLLAAAVPLFAPIDTAHAQVTDSQLWAQFNYNAWTSKRVRFLGEVQPRQGDDFRRPSLLIVRTAVGYQVAPKWSVWLGYGWTPAFLPRYTGEHRVFGQLQFEDRFHGIDTIQRTRLEQRYIDRAGASAVRLRHMSRFSRPLEATGRWIGIGFDELFWNLNSTPRGPQAGFDQNRLFLGVGRVLDRHARIEFGYLASFVNPPRQVPDRRLDVLLISLNYNR